MKTVWYLITGIIGFIISFPLFYYIFETPQSIQYSDIIRAPLLGTLFLLAAWSLYLIYCFFNPLASPTYVAEQYCMKYVADSQFLIPEGANITTSWQSRPHICGNDYNTYVQIWDLQLGYYYNRTRMPYPESLYV